MARLKTSSDLQYTYNSIVKEEKIILQNLIEDINPTIPIDLTDFGNDLEKLQNNLNELLIIELLSLGFDSSALSSDRSNNIALSLGIKDFYIQWLEASISKVWAKQNNTIHLCRQDRDFVWNKWNSFKEYSLKNNSLNMRVTLVDQTLRNLQSIITKKVRATDIMFPNGSMGLVEGIFKNNPQANYFNSILCQSVSNYIQKNTIHFQKNPLRIIEIGAGTGGTTAPLITALSNYKSLIREYCYTDLSQLFLLHGEQEYLNQAPYLTFSRLDISKDLSSQEVDIGSYDIVIASNVLHATQDIKKTLLNTKKLLNNEGIILLNEINSSTLFAHLTFGLLEGWWLFEDADLRIPYCPALSSESWNRVLTKTGFTNIQYPAELGHLHGQQIIVASNNYLIN